MQYNNLACQALAFLPKAKPQWHQKTYKYEAAFWKGRAEDSSTDANSSVTSTRLDQISTSSPSTKPVSSTAVETTPRSQSLKSLGSLQLQYDTFSTPLLSSLDRRPITSFYSDEASSVDESCPDPVIRRRTEAQRIEVIQSYSVCGEMEPYRVFCTRCDQWVNLGKKQTYTVKPWEKHRNSLWSEGAWKENLGALSYLFYLVLGPENLQSTVFIFIGDAQSRLKQEKMATMMMMRMTVHSVVASSVAKSEKNHSEDWARETSFSWSRCERRDHWNWQGVVQDMPRVDQTLG